MIDQTIIRIDGKASTDGIRRALGMINPRKTITPRKADGPVSYYPRDGR